jgi:cytochrome c551/c552
MSALGSVAVGAIAVAGLAAAWVAVQGAWGRVFPRSCSDPDVLAGRKGCLGCKNQDEDVCDRGGQR